MYAFELAEELKKAMFETGHGSKPIIFVTPIGEAFSITDVRYDEPHLLFIVKGMETEL